MPQAFLDACVSLPVHRAIRVLPVQAVAPGASEELKSGNLSYEPIINANVRDGADKALSGASIRYNQIPVNKPG